MVYLLGTQAVKIAQKHISNPSCTNPLKSAKKKDPSALDFWFNKCGIPF